MRRSGMVMTWSAFGTLAVFLDGATVPPGMASCHHDARWFSRTLGVALFVELSAKPPGRIAEDVAKAIDTVAASHSKTCEIDDKTHPSATIAVVRQLPDVYEYYVLGDSTIVFETAKGQLAARSDNRLQHVATAEREHAVAMSMADRERATAFVDLVKAEQTQRSVRGGYWIASANPDTAARGRQGHLLRKEVRRVALLSDGAAAIVERYGLMDWRSALDLMKNDGPQAVIGATREAEHSDVKAERWPRSKIHDDATAIFCMPE